MFNKAQKETFIKKYLYAKISAQTLDEKGRKT